MIAIRKCEEHNDQNPDCPVCYPPVGDIPIDAAAHKRTDDLWGAVEQIWQINEDLYDRIDILGESFRKLTEITEKLLDEVESLRKEIT